MTQFGTCTFHVKRVIVVFSWANQRAPKGARHRIGTTNPISVSFGEKTVNFRRLDDGPPVMSAQSPGDLEDADSSRSAAVTSAQMGAGRRDVQEATKSKGTQRDRPTAQGRSNCNMVRAPTPPQSAEVREEGRVKWHVGCGAIGN
jgi:hypothetical protein